MWKPLRSRSARPLRNHQMRRLAMDTANALDEINQPRRRFLGIATMAVAAAPLGIINPAMAQRETKMPVIKPGTNTSFGPLKQIDAGVLNIGYAEAGPANGPAVILM